MGRQLLPPNRTPLEAALADAMTLETDPALLATLWDADDCPAAFLPYLAWALSVEGWDSAITEAQQRELIRTAVPTHAKKGTPSGVLDALRAIGLDAAFGDRDPALAPHAFTLDINIHDRGIDAATQGKIEALVDEYKNVRSYVKQISVGLIERVKARTCIAVYGGDVVTVYPFSKREASVSSALAFLSGTYVVDIVSVRGSN